jgi:sugar-specific transcriptional regulator TrmB
MNIRETLNQIGLKDKKAEVYLACLEAGGATAYLIAKKVGLKRPTTYDIINQLMKEGLVYKTMHGNIKHYSPADPQKLLFSIQEKEKKAKSIMDDLQNLYNSPKSKPFIRYFEDKEGIKEMYEDSLRSLKKGDEILGYVGEDVARYLPEYADDYVRRRVEKRIRFRGYIKKIPEYCRIWQKTLSSYARQKYWKKNIFQ